MTETANRTTPTPEQLRIWRDYIELAELIRARLATRMQADTQLSLGDYQVLLALSEAPQKTLRSSDLAAVMNWERSRLSHHLGRMEKRALVARAACADDIHGVNVIMTDEGATAFRRGTVPHLQVIHELFVTAFDPEQFAAIDDINQTLRNHLGHT